jgi:uncharacterized protein YbjT (DUF2867 family)
MILITAANGKTGRHVIPQLAAVGEQVRAFVHTQDAADLKSLGAEEVMAGDLLDAPGLAKAMAGVRAVVHVGPPFHPHETEMGKAVIDAAVAAQVERFVYFSVIHPQLGALVNHRAKLPVEEHLLESGLNYTVLQPMHYMQNIRVRDVVQSGVLWQMIDLDRRLSHVDLADAAEVAVKALTEDGHFGATYELCGNDHLSGVELAAVISRESGRPVEARRLPLENFLSFGAIAASGDHQKDGMRRLFEYYGRHGIFGNANVLTWLLGRPPTTFAEYVRREMNAAG